MCRYGWLQSPMAVTYARTLLILWTYLLVGSADTDVWLSGGDAHTHGLAGEKLAHVDITTVPLGLTTNLCRIATDILYMYTVHKNRNEANIFLQR